MPTFRQGDIPKGGSNSGDMRGNMPYAQGLPFATGSHTSRKAAVAASAGRQSKTARYLRLLADRGPLTDHEAREALGGPLSGINSVRNGAMQCGLVRRGDVERSSPWGRSCATWELTTSGSAAVQAR